MNLIELISNAPVIMDVLSRIKTDFRTIFEMHVLNFKLQSIQGYSPHRNLFLQGSITERSNDVDCTCTAQIKVHNVHAREEVHEVYLELKLKINDHSYRIKIQKTELYLEVTTVIFHPEINDRYYYTIMAAPNFIHAQNRIMLNQFFNINDMLLIDTDEDVKELLFQYSLCTQNNLVQNSTTEIQNDPMFFEYVKNTSSVIKYIHPQNKVII